MDTIFKNPHLKSANGRNAFDRSQHRVWHSPFGMILPIYCKRFCPDDYVELSVESQTICDTIVRPAFIRLKEHINFYCVPINMLWMPFDNLITGQDNYFSDEISKINQDVIPPAVPVFDYQFLGHVFDRLSKSVDIQGYNKLPGALRLLDLLGYGNYYTLCDNAESGGGVIDYDVVAPYLTGLEPMNFFALLAYQKVYYDYYRNPKYEKNDTAAYNLDDIPGGNILGNESQRHYGIFDCHYAWAKKDYFTDVSPNILPKSTDIGYDGLTPGAPSDQLWSFFGVPGASDGSAIAVVTNNDTAGASYQNHGDRVNLASASARAALPNSYSAGLVRTNTQSNVAALRFAFAYDKLLRRMREAGGTFDAQMLAQFGIVPYDQRHGKCIYIGGQTNRLVASDVVSTNNNQSTDNPSLGFLGGQINVYSPARQKFKYHCKDHCIIIGVYHTSLDFDYPSYGVERDNLARQRFDWFNPAFEDLGLQPTFRMELLNIKQDVNQGVVSWEPAEVQHDATQRDILGYSIRYQEYKTSIDRVYGLFNFGSGSIERNAWVTQFLPFLNGYNNGKRVAPLTAENMTFNPMMFNQIVSTNYDGDWNTDHFNHNTYVHCKSISNMSVLGENF